MVNSYQSSATTPIYRGMRIVWYIVNIIEILLVFRFILRMFGANPNAGFSSFIYNLTYPLVAPFINVFGISEVQNNTIEWPTILAMIIYWLIGWAIVKLFFVGKPVSTAEAAHRINKEDKSL